MPQVPDSPRPAADFGASDAVSPLPRASRRSHGSRPQLVLGRVREQSDQQGQFDEVRRDPKNQPETDASRTVRRRAFLKTGNRVEGAEIRVG